MKNFFSLSCLMLAGAACGLKAVDQHHVWNRTGETILVKFEHNLTGNCSVTYGIQHQTPALPYGDPQARIAPDWLQPIDTSGGENCPIRKIVVTGLTGKIKGQWAEFTSFPTGGGKSPYHFVIDRNGHTITISTGDLRTIYKRDQDLRDKIMAEASASGMTAALQKRLDTEIAVPELILKRYNDADAKQAGQPHYYSWNSDEIMRKNIKKELQNDEDLMSNPSIPMAQKAARIQTLLHDARQKRDQWLQVYNQLPK